MGIKTKVRTTVKAIKDCKRLWRIVAVVYYAWVTYGIATDRWHPLVNAILFVITLVCWAFAEWEAREWKERCGAG